MVVTLDSGILGNCLEILNKPENFCLKPFQEKAILSVMNYKRSIVIVGTGYGKTLIMQIAGLYLGYSDNWVDKPSVTVIISPLLSIVGQQIMGTNSVGNSSVDISLDVTTSTSIS